MQDFLEVFCEKKVSDHMKWLFSSLAGDSNVLFLLHFLEVLSRLKVCEFFFSPRFISFVFSW